MSDPKSFEAVVKLNNSLLMELNEERHKNIHLEFDNKNLKDQLKLTTTYVNDLEATLASNQEEFNFYRSGMTELIEDNRKIKVLFEEIQERTNRNTQEKEQMQLENALLKLKLERTKEDVGTFPDGESDEDEEKYEDAKDSNLK